MSLDDAWEDKVNIKHLATDEIKYDREDRQRHTIDNLEELCLSIQTCGLINPIIVKEDMTLVAGERRLTAYKKLGRGKIPARIWEDLPEDEAQVIELQENLARKSISWQEQCEAMERIHLLKVAKDPEQTKRDTADAIGVTYSHLCKVLSVVEASKEDPAVMKAVSFTTAHRAQVRKTDRAISAELDKIDTGTLKEREPAVVESPFAVESVDFTKWASTYKGDKFNFLHCDFPYGIGIDRAQNINIGLTGSYKDSPDVYFGLLKTLGETYERYISPSAHVMFWFSMNYYHETLTFFKEETDFEINPFPLIWVKSDKAGTLPDPDRGPRRIYETALFGSRGDRKIVKAIVNAVMAPRGRDADEHVSEKNPSVLKELFRMVIDDTTKVLDPTCGSGNAVIVARDCGAASGLGLELDPAWAKRGQEKLHKTQIEIDLEDL